MEDGAPREHHSGKTVIINEILMQVVSTWLTLSNMLSERTLTPKSTYCVFHLYEALEQTKLICGRKTNPNGGCP